MRSQRLTPVKAAFAEEDFDGVELVHCTEKRLQKMLSRTGLHDSEKVAKSILALRDTSAVCSEQVEGQICVRTPDSQNWLKADASFDSWSYGLLLMHLLTGQPLFNQTVEGDLDDKNLKELAGWNSQRRMDVLVQIADPDAKDLISKLLHEDPQQRMTMNGVLEHPFFSGGAVASKSKEANLFRVVIFFSRGELKHDKKMLTKLDQLKQCITNSMADRFQWRKKQHDQPDLECFMREVGAFMRLNVQLAHLIGHGGEQGFWWHPRSGRDEGEFQDPSDFVAAIALQKETLECVFLDGCSMGQIAHMLQQQGGSFHIL